MSPRPLHTLAELGRLVAAALADAPGYEGQPTARVREVPDLRAIRYYTTLGLLDRPAGWRGRTALYDRRHILQLVAIKRLQAEGLPLVTVQERLAGLSDAALRRIADIPSGVPVAPPTPPPEAPPTTQRRFWASRPAPASVLQGLPLQDGLTLLVELIRAPDAADLAALAAAARPLIETLKARNLVARQERKPT